MAVRFDAAADRLLKTSAVLDANSPYTIMLWYYIVTDLNATGALWTIHNNNFGGLNADGIGIDTNGTTVQAAVSISSTPNTVNGSDLSTGTWYHLALVRSSTTSQVLYVDGDVDATNTTDISSRGSASARSEIGAIASFNIQPVDARVAYLKAWDTNLTQAEVQSEMYTIRPQRTANIHGWWPCFPGATERLTDYSGNGGNWTAGGTLTDEDPPPVGWGARVLWPGYAGGGDAVALDARLDVVGMTGTISAVARTLFSDVRGAGSSAGTVGIARSLMAHVDAIGNAASFIAINRSVTARVDGMAAAAPTFVIDRELLVRVDAVGDVQSAPRLTRGLAMHLDGWLTEVTPALAVERALVSRLDSITDTVLFMPVVRALIAGPSGELLMTATMTTPGAGAVALATTTGGQLVVTPALSVARLLTSQLDGIGTATPALSVGRSMMARLDTSAIMAPTFVIDRELLVRVDAVGDVRTLSTLIRGLTVSLDGLLTVEMAGPAMARSLIARSDGVGAVASPVEITRSLVVEIDGVGWLDPTLTETLFTGSVVEPGGGVLLVVDRSGTVSAMVGRSGGVGSVVEGEQS